MTTLCREIGRGHFWASTVIRCFVPWRAFAKLDQGAPEVTLRVAA
jgi:hypothetical protein